MNGVYRIYVNLTTCNINLKKKKLINIHKYLISKENMVKLMVMTT
ncbi:hypothetical protein [Methanotorris igneus]|nr:hypothetical protein [Methanotorris igneus]